jgi:PAS domain S-box-containing protein
MSSLSQAWYVRYGVAVASVLLATVLRLLLDSFLNGYFPFATLFLAILFSAWWGGYGPALVATAVGAVLADWWLLPPRDSFVMANTVHQTGLAFYLLVGGGMAFLGGSMHAAQFQAQQQTQEAERQRLQWQITLLSIGDGVIVTDAAGRIVSLNSMAEVLTGWTNQEAHGQPVETVYRLRCEHKPESKLPPVLEVLKTGVPRELGNHTVLIARDNTERIILDSAAPIRQGQGQEITGVVLTFRDVTARRQAERELRQQREWFRVALASIGDAVIATDIKGRVTFLNPVAQALTGWQQEEAQRQPLEHVFRIRNERTGQPVENPVVKVFREGKAVGLANHTVLVAKDGTTYPIEDSAAPILDDDGTILGVIMVFRDATKERQAQESRRRLAAIVACSEDAIIGKSLEGIITEWNTAAERLYGYTAAEIIGQPFALLVPSERSAEVERSIQRLRSGEHLEHFETVRRRKDGSLVDVSVSYSPIRDETGAVEGTAVITRNITEQKQAYEALRRSEQELTDFFENASVGLHLLGPDGRILRANRAELEMLGYSREEYVGHPIAEFHVEETVIRDMLECHARGEKVSNREARLRCKDGTIKDVLIDSSVLFEKGRFLYIRCFTRDITDRKRLEADLLRRVNELAAAEGRIRSVVDHVIDGIITINAQGMVEAYNPAAQRIFGYPPAEVLGQNVKMLMPDPYHAEHDNYLTNYLRTGQGKIIGIGREVMGRRKDGTTFPLDLAVSEFSWEGQRFFTGIVRDITARRRAEQTAHFLADASAALAGIVDYESTLQKVARLAVPFFADWCTVDMLEPDGTLRRLAVAHTDPAKVQLVLDLQKRFPPNPDAPRGVWHILRTGQSEIIPEIPAELLEATFKDQELREIMRTLGLRSFVGVPLSVRGKVLGVISFVTAESQRLYNQQDLAVAEDLAHRAAVAIENARLYEALRESDRRKDEFLAVLAHELRNPLAPVRNALHILKLAPGDSAVTARARDMAERQVHHLTRLVDDLLDVSRIMRGKVDLRKERVELAALVARAVETAKPVIEAEKHELTVTLPDEPLWLDADVVRISQVIGNLLNNAAKYTEPGGQIWLTAEQAGEEAIIRVRDTGIGIAPEMLPRIFEMFMQVASTHMRAQGGLGIGLTLVKTLVEMHGGSVSARSEGLGRGSEFSVRLPLRAESRHPVSASLELPPVPPVPQQRILIVDDNVDAAESLALLLQLEGHEVQVAHEGKAALALVEKHLPDLAFLDIGMPGMDGYELAQRIRRQPQFQKMFLVALTGWGQEEDRRRTREAGFDHHLVKPVEPEALRQLLMTRRVR